MSDWNKKPLVQPNLLMDEGEYFKVLASFFYYLV